MNKSNYRFPVVSGNVVVRLAVLLTVLLTIILQMTMPRPVDAVATVPTTMNFQGRLTNNAGNIMADGLYNMRFRIYDASTGGTLKWTELRETTNRVQITNGLFSVQLGQVTPLDPSIFASGSLYFEIELPTPATATCSTASCASFTEGPMTPRNKLSTSAYAYNSETLDGLDSSQFARTDAANTFTGTQTVRADSTNAFQLQNAAGTSTFMNADTTNSTLTLKSGADTAVVGSEMFTGSYSFTATTNWTTNSLTGSSATITHSAGSTVAIGPTPAMTITAGEKYLVSVTLSAGSAGDYISASLGGGSLSLSPSQGTYTTVVTATNTNNLSFSPSSNFVGTISNISIKPLTTTAAVLQLSHSTGAAALEMRVGVPTYLNTFIGLQAGRSNVNGSDNTAVGANALQNATSGTGNTAIGGSALTKVTTGSSNSALGFQALTGTQTGNENVAIGRAAMQGNVTGSYNVALGSYTGYTAGSGSSMSTFLGYYAGSYDGSFTNVSDLQNATAIGAYSVVQSSNSIILGRVNTETRVGIGTTVPDSLFSVSPVYYPVPANSNIKVSQSGNTVTSSGSTPTVFTSAMVGMKLIFAGGQSGTITAVNSATSLTLSTSQTVASNVFRIHTGGLQVAASGDTTIKHTSTTAFQVQNSAGTNILGVDTSAGKVTMQNTEISAGKSLTLVGGNTASRPASPTEGMVYYDTDTKQLLTYANGKWQADGKDAIIVAATNSSTADKAAADYVADGTADQTEINAALTAANPAGAGRKTGKVVLLAGTYTINASISVPNNTTLAGVSSGTLITIPNALVSNLSAIVNTDQTTGTGVTIRDLKLDGNKANQTDPDIGMIGINLTGMGGGSGATARQGARILNVRAENWYQFCDIVCPDSAGIALVNSAHNILSGNTVQGNTDNGIYLSNSNYNTLSDNYAYGNDKGIHLVSSSSYNTIARNTVQGGGFTTWGVYLQSSSNNTLADNTLQGYTNGYGAYLESSSTNTITGNNVQGNIYGINLYTNSSNNTISGNTIRANTSYGIQLQANSGNTVSGNKIHDNGNTTTNQGIVLIGASSNSITGNSVTDTSCTGTCYAIDLNATSNTNYLADNTLGTGSVNDAGTGTKYASQLDSSGQLISSASTIKSSAATAFQIQNAGATETLLGADATTNRIVIGNSTAAAAGDVTLLVLDKAVSTITPTGVAGAMYYDSTNNKFKCYTTAWVDCDTGGAGSGVTTVGAFSNTSLANGASISGTTITFGAADGTNPGMVSTTTQTFAGDKTLTGATTVKNTSASAFTVQNAGSANVMVVDTSASIVKTENLAALTNGAYAINQVTSTLSITNNGTVAYPSVRVGSDTFARVAYEDTVNKDLMFIQCTNADCTTKNTTTVDSTGDVGGYSSLALGSDGFARIAYHDSTNASLKFSQCTNADCTTKNTTTVDNSAVVGLYTSLEIGSDGFARISYYDITNKDLKFVQCTNAACTTKNTTVVDSTGEVGQYTSLEIGSDGFARISYSATTAGQLKFVQCTNAACTTKNTTIVDNTGGLNSSVALGSDGFARISYYNGTDLKFAQCTNADCTTKNTTTVDSTGDVGGYSSLALGSDGFARVAYYDITSKDLKFAQCTNADCTTKNTTVVDGIGEVGEQTSHALGSDGFARIVYMGDRRNSIKFARLTSSLGGAAYTGSSLGLDSARYGKLYSTGANVTGGVKIALGADTTEYALDISAAGGVVNARDAQGNTIVDISKYQLSYSTQTGLAGTVFSVDGMSGAYVQQSAGGPALNAEQYGGGDALKLMKVEGEAGMLIRATLDSGAELFTVDGQGMTTFRSATDTATAFRVQNAAGVSIFNIDATTSTVTIGSATNGAVISANGITLAGTARPTRTVNLSPEYAGATFTGTGTGNLTSDFCSATGRLAVNTTVCNTTGDEHNYYSWTSTTTGTQAYSIYVRYKMPSDFSSGSLSNVYMFGKRAASATDTVTLSLFQADGTQCGTSTNVATSGASSAWTETIMAGTLSSCSISAGDRVTMRITMSVGTNGNTVQAGAIRFDYKSAF